ncbi:DUF1697 domain-containing protein [Microbacterium sp. NPDC057407]|uniref:DUF1697 domain-containing protein n=1 Tax=Microbacterium sp. NPDC057407 TaxID=3346120 RepID=UPI00366BAE69
MTTWVALLRGVNVGGITVRSADLASLFTTMGFTGVRTVLASGNVVFDAPHDPAERPRLKAAIESELRAQFDYDAWIVLVTLGELADAADAFPFDASDARRQPWVVFCADAETRAALLAATEGMDASADPVAEGPGVVYWNPVKGTTVSTPFAKVLEKAAYRSRTTNRNLRTLRRIVG